MPVTDKDNRPLSHPGSSKLIHELAHSTPQRQTFALQLKLQS